MKKSASAIIGACGEFFVASYLTGCGFIVALPRSGVPGLDMLVSNESGSVSFRVQVKTGREPFGKSDKRPIHLWRTSYSVLENPSSSLLFAYVTLGDWPENDAAPDVLFVPNSNVQACLRQLQEEKSNFPCFWIFDDDADKYRGQNGLNTFTKQFVNQATNNL